MTEVVAKPRPLRMPRQRANTGGLRSQIRWFIHLRWLAATAVAGAALLDRFWLHWRLDDQRLLLVGVAIFAYNAVLLGILRRLSRARRARPLLLLAWAQLLLDMSCLTLLNVWTGGVESPLRGFFV